MSKKKRLFGILLALPPLLLGLLYGGGYIAQFMRNYHEWEAAGGTPGNGTSPTVPSFAVSECLRAIFTMPYGIVGILICVGALVLLIVMVMRMGYSETGEYDKDRNFIYSKKGTYGTSGFMSEKEAEEIFNLRTSLKNHNGTIFGLLNGRYVCMPEESMLNKNVAVYGASGSMKTRAYCINRILQATVPNKDGKMESLIICDPKSELYEKTSELLRKTHTVKVFNLVCPENSDSWNCLAEIEGDELMAQRFCDVIIKNTGSERGDHFWDSAEMNLLKALVLYVEQGYLPERKNIGQVELATMSFGQSFQVTPIQMATTFSSIINGGNRVTPHFGKRVLDQDGTVAEIFSDKKGKRILSEETSATMRALLESVVSEGGGKNAAVEGYRIGGKTATSQTLPRSANKYISSFVGFAPADDPQILGMCIIYNLGNCETR